MIISFRSVRVIDPTKTSSLPSPKSSKLKMIAEPPQAPGTPPTDETTPHPPAKGGPEFWRRSFSYITGMGMTDEDRARFEHSNEEKKIGEECRKCEKQRDYLMKYSTCPAMN